MKNLLLPMAILLIVAIGCSDNKKKSVHKHGLEPFNLTLFTDHFEVFIKTKPFVKGKENKLEIYVTDLYNGYSPINEDIKVVFFENESNTYNEVEIEKKNNLLIATITPSMHGTGTVTVYVNEESVSSEVFKIYTDEHSAEEIGHNDLTPSQVNFNKDQLWNIEFATQLVKLSDFNEIIETSGEIRPAPGDEVVVSAKSSGIVIFGQEGLVIGKPISKGISLFVISNSDISVDNVDTKFQQAKVSLDLAKTNYERNQDLIKDQIISQKELLDSKAEYENALIDYNLHAKNYSSGGIKVSSTIGGFLKNLLVSEGQYVEVGTPLAVVSQNKKLIIEADLTQKHFDKINTINSASFMMAGNDVVYHSDSLNGSIFSAGTSINSEHPFIPISIEVDNVGELISGAMLQVFLKSTELKNVIVIPTSALLEEQGIFSVFVQIDGETFEKREVSLGATDGNKVVILSGVSNNERIVTKGVYQLKLAMSSGSLPAHSHEH